MLGVVNLNKCVDKVVCVLVCDFELVVCIEYYVFGGVGDQECWCLEVICVEVGFFGLILEGCVSDECLIEGMVEVDVICCLCDLVLEGVFVLVVEGMQFGVLVIVFNVGFYVDLFDEYVFKILQGDCEDELFVQFQYIDCYCVEGWQMGVCVCEWVYGEFFVKYYVIGLDQFIFEFIVCELYLLISKVLGCEFGWMGILGNSFVVGRVVDVLDCMFVL